uniref:Lcl C-terminal domain-containing protein n=1 Tax=Candidatus Electronema sp. TaxID=2698783 RepID=UPI004055A3F9
MNPQSETPTINQQAFPNTEATGFWSGSPLAVVSDYAWSVYFGNGYSYRDGRDYSNAVRLVRGGQ